MDEQILGKDQALDFCRDALAFEQHASNVAEQLGVAPSVAMRPKLGLRP